MTTVVCVGHSALDRVFTIDAVVAPPAKLRASGFRESGGGMAANAAVAVAHLGGTARFWGPCGDDDIAERMQADFVRHGVDASHLHRLKGRTSSHSVILVDAQGERLIVNARGTALESDADWLPLDALASPASAARTGGKPAALHARSTPHIAAAIALGMAPACDALLADVRWPIGSRMALEAARRAGIPTLLDGDTAERAVLHALAGLADYCLFSEPGFRSFCSAAEADAAARTGLAPKQQAAIDESDIAMGLGAAIALGARVAAVTLGARGCAWLTADQPGHLHFTPAYAVTAVDTTGAGDVFHGAVALLAGEYAKAARVPLEAMFRFASAAAAIKVTRAGARSMPSRGEVEAFLDAH